MTGFRAWVRGLFSTGEEPGPDPYLPWTLTRAPGPRSFAEDHNDSSLALYGRLPERPGNLFFSPFSIRAALAITYAGARGDTAAQMAEAMHFAPSGESLHVAFGELVRRLKTARDGEYEITVANSLWVQDGAPLQAAFLDLVTRHYGGGINVVDFRGGPEAARLIVNRWVESQTKNKIRELIPSRGVDTDTRLVLVNAVHFKGLWVLQFPKAATCHEPFYVEDGSKVQAPLMHQFVSVRYVEARGFQAVDLDYRGGNLSMLVLLPRRKNGLRQLESRLSAQMLHSCVAEMSVRHVELFLRFRITWGPVDLSACLRALGMPIAFTRLQADFSGLNGYEPSHEDSLFISAVYHKAFVEVNEEGTEAAAATGIGMPASAAIRSPSRRRYQSSELTIRSCSPSAVGTAARSCSSDAWSIRPVRIDRRRYDDRSREEHAAQGTSRRSCMQRHTVRRRSRPTLDPAPTTEIRIDRRAP